MNNHIVSEHHVDVNGHEIVVFFVLYNIKLIGPNNDGKNIEEHVPKTIPNHNPSQYSEESKIGRPFDSKCPRVKTEYFEEDSVINKPEITFGPPVVPIDVDVPVEANG